MSVSKSPVFIARLQIGDTLIVVPSTISTRRFVITTILCNSVFLKNCPNYHGLCFRVLVGVEVQEARGPFGIS